MSKGNSDPVFMGLRYLKRGSWSDDESGVNLVLSVFRRSDNTSFIDETSPTFRPIVIHGPGNGFDDIAARDWHGLIIFMIPRSYCNPRDSALLQAVPSRLTRYPANIETFSW